MSVTAAQFSLLHACPNLVEYIDGMREGLEHVNRRLDVNTARHQLTDRQSGHVLWLFTEHVN